LAISSGDASNAPEYPDFVAFVSAALQDEKLGKRAIEVILLHQLPSI